MATGGSNPSLWGFLKDHFALEHDSGPWCSSHTGGGSTAHPMLSIPLGIPAVLPCQGQGQAPELCQGDAPKLEHKGTVPPKPFLRENKPKAGHNCGAITAMAATSTAQKGEKTQRREFGSTFGNTGHSPGEGPATKSCSLALAGQRATVATSEAAQPEQPCLSRVSPQDVPRPAAPSVPGRNYDASQVHPLPSNKHCLLSCHTSVQANTPR